VTATISLSNAPQNDTQITYTVNGVEHTAMIKGGATLTQADLGDLLVSNPSLVTVSAQITNVTGGNFEDVKWSSSSTDLRLDHPVLVGNSGVTVNENDLPGGTSPDVPALVQTGNRDGCRAGRCFEYQDRRHPCVQQRGAGQRRCGQGFRWGTSVTDLMRLRES